MHGISPLNKYNIYKIEKYVIIIIAVIKRFYIWFYRELVIGVN